MKSYQNWWHRCRHQLNRVEQSSCNTDNYLSESLPKYLLLLGTFLFTSVVTGSGFDLLTPCLQSSVYQSLWKKYLSIQKILPMLFRMFKCFTSGLSPGKENFNRKEVVSIDFLWQIQTRDCRHLPFLTMVLRTIRMKMSWAMIKESLDKNSQSVYIWKSSKSKKMPNNLHYLKKKGSRESDKLHESISEKVLQNSLWRKNNVAFCGGNDLL